MEHISKVMRGITAYIDEEIVGKLAGSWKAWVIGSAAGIATARMEGIVRHLANNQLVKASGLIEGENIDVDAIYRELYKQAQRGSMTLDIPLVGPITFSAADVDALYRHIKGAL